MTRIVPLRQSSYLTGGGLGGWLGSRDHKRIAILYLAAGIVGTVITVKDRTVTLRSGDAKFEVTKASVSEIVADTNATVVKV